MAVAAVAACAVIWGTTWYAITWQLGAVDPIASVLWRFGLAAALLAGVCLATGRSLRLTRAQHLAVAGQGGFAFAFSYAMVYAAESRVASAVVAVIFSAMAFLTLALFRVVERQTVSPRAWAGTILGLAGVVVLSSGAVLGADLGREAALGVGFAGLGVTASTLGNWFAWKSQQRGAAVIPGTAWAMTYGSGLLLLWGLVSGVSFGFDPSPGYVISLLYLAVVGSVIAFVLYFSLARSHGYALASYVSALTPLVAMGVSVLFEDARFGWSAAGGLILVLAGQGLLMRARSAGKG